MHKYWKIIKPFIVLLIVFSLLATSALLAPATRVEAQADLLTSNHEFNWARGMGGTGWDHGSRTDEDANGNVYAIGTFEGTVDFDPGAGIFNLTSAGSSDVFISKLDGKGSLLWAKRIGGPGDDYGVGLYVSPAGDFYITGDFSATADFDPGAGTLNLTSAGNVDIYIAKYNSSGELVWAKAMGGTAEDAGG